MREETRHRLQPVERHARLLGKLLQRFALQIAELMLNPLQRGNEHRGILDEGRRAHRLENGRAKEAAWGNVTHKISRSV